MNIVNLNNIINLVKKKKINKTYDKRTNFFLKKKFKKKFSLFRIFNFNLYLKYVSFGTTDITNIFTFNEFIIFYFYWKNKNYYQNVLDVGCNIGLHSIILSKLNFNVTAVEPDPNHIKIARNLFKKNKVNVKIIQKAISDRNGKDDFIRIRGNTTASHLNGTKLFIYGKTDRLPVQTLSIKNIIKKFDLIKIDCEGAEKKIFSATTLKDWKNTDAIIEITDNESRKIIYNLFKKTNFLYSQKIGWKSIKKISDLPKNYKEGSVFLSSKRPFDIFH